MFSIAFGRGIRHWRCRIFQLLRPWYRCTALRAYQPMA